MAELVIREIRKILRTTKDKIIVECHNLQPPEKTQHVDVDENDLTTSYAPSFSAKFANSKLKFHLHGSFSLKIPACENHFWFLDCFSTTVFKYLNACQSSFVVLNPAHLIFALPPMFSQFLSVSVTICVLLFLSLCLRRND